MKDILFSQPHILENSRARLVPLEEHHGESLWEAASDPSIWAYTHVKIKNESELADYISAALQERADQQSYPFAVYDKLHECWAGSTRFGSLALEHKRAEIGWTWYKTSLQGSGLNAACKLLLLDFAFGVLQLNRVELKTSLTNRRSQKAMEKLGAVKEGLFRRHMVNPDGTLRDSVFYSFIKEEWEETRDAKFGAYLSL